MMSRSLRGSVVLALLIVGVLPAQAAATFPGRNGDVLLSLVAGYNPPGWSDDVGGPFTTSLKTRDRRTGRVRLLRRCIETRTRTTSGGFVRSGCSLSDGRFSPDGRRIAFVIATFDGRGGFTTRVALMRADGSALRELPATGQSRPSARSPLWAPDGKFLMMFGVPPAPNANNAPDLYRISLDGARTRRVTVGGVGEADWSAHGDRADPTERAKPKRALPYAHRWPPTSRSQP